MPLALIDAEDAVDTGDIWRIDTVRLDGTELSDAIQAKVATGTTALMTWALDHCPTTRPVAQTGEPSYYPRRYPVDSEVQPHHTLEQIFDLLRVADPARYPAFVVLRGRRFALRLEPLDE